MAHHPLTAARGDEHVNAVYCLVSCPVDGPLSSSARTQDDPDSDLRQPLKHLWTYCSLTLCFSALRHGETIGVRPLIGSLPMFRSLGSTAKTRAKPPGDDALPRCGHALDRTKHWATQREWPFRLGRLGHANWFCASG